MLIESKNVEKPVSSREWCNAFLLAPAPHNTCGSRLLGSARHFFDMRGEVLPWVGVYLPLALSLSFENSELNGSTVQRI